MRRFLALSFFISIASTGCTVGDPKSGTPDPGVGPDASGDPSPDGGQQLTCEPPASVLPNGNHNAGQDCLTCHTGTGAAPKWTLAGTLYDSGNGQNAVSGATIVVTDASGASFKLVTASNGNFYTGRAIQFPVHIKASKCPDEQTMQAGQQVGDCNSCHGGQSRVHLP
jgi:hypothetical protein